MDNSGYISLEEYLKNSKNKLSDNIIYNIVCNSISYLSTMDDLNMTVEGFDQKKILTNDSNFYEVAIVNLEEKTEKNSDNKIKNFLTDLLKYMNLDFPDDPSQIRKEMGKMFINNNIIENTNPGNYKLIELSNGMKYNIFENLQNDRNTLFEVEHSGNKYIMKLFKNKSIYTCGFRECSMLKYLKDIKGVPKLFDYGWVDEDEYYVVTEHYGDDLINLATKNENMVFDDIFLSVLDILEQIHNKGFVHGDVKTDNILYNGKETYIIDFEGISPWNNLYNNTPCTMLYVSDTYRKTKKISPRADLESLVKSFTKLVEDNHIYQRIYNALLDINYNKMPDYERIRNLFKNYIKKKNNNTLSNK